MSEKIGIPVLGWIETVEATVTIDGTPLTQAQSMALRVAVSNMLSELVDEEHARRLGPIAGLYRLRLSEVQELIHRGCK